MAREYDSRVDDDRQADAESIARLDSRAAEISDGLPGDHWVWVSEVDLATGRAATVVSEGAELAGADLAAAGLAHAQSLSPLLAPRGPEQLEFRVDPNVLETSSGAHAVHLQQTRAGIEIFEAAQVVCFTPAGEVESLSGRASDPIDVTGSEAALSAEQAAAKAREHLADPGEDATRTDQFGQQYREEPHDPGAFELAVAPQPIWFDRADSLLLAWQVVLDLPAVLERVLVVVDAHDGAVLYSHSLVAGVAAKGNVFVTNPQKPRRVVDFPPAAPPSEYAVAPVAEKPPANFPRSDWVDSNETAGNNAISRLIASATSTGTGAGTPPLFDPPPPDPANPASLEKSEDQRRLNLFYFINFMHDFFYLLGFREADRNYQNENLGLGGLGGDRIEGIIYPQEIESVAQFTFGLEGSFSRLNAGLRSDTGRHSALDSTLIFHECTHGLTNRLVGGASALMPFTAAQSAGMAEGWSDYVACTVNGTTTFGSWLFNEPVKGARRAPYDTVFPGDFGMIGRFAAPGVTGYREAHEICEVWAAPLLELNRRIDPALMIQVVVDALKQTPANPNFTQARTAILATLRGKALTKGWSRNLYNRRLHQTWRSFARFGLGLRAFSKASTILGGNIADFTVPRSFSRLGNFDRVSVPQMLVSSGRGIAIWQLADFTVKAPFVGLEGSKVGAWTLRLSEDEVGPIGDFDGDGRAEILISNRQQLAVFRRTASGMEAPLIAADGAEFDTAWKFSPTRDDICASGDFDGDGRPEILVSRPQGIGIWEFSGHAMTVSFNVLNDKMFDSWKLNTRTDDFGPIGDFDGDKQKEILVSRRDAIAILKLGVGTMKAPMYAVDGTEFRNPVAGQPGWKLKANEICLGPIGDFDGDKSDEIFVSSPYGIAILKLAGDKLEASFVAPIGTTLDGWTLTADTSFGPVGDFDGDKQTEIIATNSHGLAILKLAGHTMKAQVKIGHGEKIGIWELNTHDDKFGPVGDFDSDTRDEVMVSNRQFVGTLEINDGKLTSHAKIPTGAPFDQWTLDAPNDYFGAEVFASPYYRYR